MTITRSDYLNGLINEFMPILSVYLERRQNDPSSLIVIKLLLQIWHRYENNMTFGEFPDWTEDEKGEMTPPLYKRSDLDDEYSDLITCINELKQIV